MNNEDQDRVFLAVESQGDRRYVTPSGPFLSLLSEFVLEGKIREISEAFLEFARRYPTNANFVRGRVPAMLFSYWSRGEIDFDFFRWSTENPNWAEDIKEALSRPETFDSIVNEMDKTIRENLPAHRD